MDLPSRKILPRTRPSSSVKRGADSLVTESASTPNSTLPNSHRHHHHHHPQHQQHHHHHQHQHQLVSRHPPFWPASDPTDEMQPARKRQHTDRPSPSHALPSVRHLLAVPPDLHLPAEFAENSAAAVGPGRLVRAANGQYFHPGVFIFQAPAPAGRGFPECITKDSRTLSFAVVEPELVEVFQHAWCFRQYLRPRRLGDPHFWWDHILINDAYGIDSVLQHWTTRYEPGAPQYSASMLYKNCLWLYYHRSIQPSRHTSAFEQVVKDGLHFIRTCEKALGGADRSVLLIPIFLLGVSAFHPAQRREVIEVLSRMRSASPHISHHVITLLETAWGMMEEGNVESTWDWERIARPDPTTVTAADTPLVELLRDPYAPQYRPSHVRSPEPPPVEFDNARFRAIPDMPAVVRPSSVPQERFRPRQPSSGATDVPSPSRSLSPAPPGHRALPPPSRHPVDVPPPVEAARPQESVEMEPTPPARSFTAPVPSEDGGRRPYPAGRKPGKSRSQVQPCATCGKELKNPSDAQKHNLQHTKPFRCHEPRCTRAYGFATENDLQRHRKSVHGASPRIGIKHGYICVACAEPSDGSPRKWWPRLDNYKAHIRRKHGNINEEALIQQSVAPKRPDDSFSEASYPTQARTATQEPEPGTQEPEAAMHSDGAPPSDLSGLSAASATSPAPAHRPDPDPSDQHQMIGPLELSLSLSMADRGRAGSDDADALRAHDSDVEMRERADDDDDRPADPRVGPAEHLHRFPHRRDDRTPVAAAPRSGSASSAADAGESESDADGGER